MVHHKLRLEVTQHVFATFTYKREYGLAECWKRVTKDYNRFFQNYRRLHRSGCEYIRTVECHADCYPHIHAVLQHKHGIFVTDSRYFDKDLYQKWKTLWKCGLSDFQAPKAGGQYPVLYIVKYITKQGSLKTLWKRFYALSTANGNNVHTSADGVEGSTLNQSMNQNTNTKNPADTLDNPSSFFCKQFKIKQCSWSRGFEFPVQRPKSLLVSQSPLIDPSNK